MGPKVDGNAKLIFVYDYDKRKYYSIGALVDNRFWVVADKLVDGHASDGDGIEPLVNDDDLVVEFRMRLIDRIRFWRAVRRLKK